MDTYGWTVVGAIATVIGAVAAIVFGLIPLLRGPKTTSTVAVQPSAASRPPRRKPASVTRSPAPVLASAVIRSRGPAPVPEPRRGRVILSALLALLPVVALMPIVALCLITLMLVEQSFHVEGSLPPVLFGILALILVPLPFALAAARLPSQRLGPICAAYGLASMSLWVTVAIASNGPSKLFGASKWDDAIEFTCYGILIVLCLLAAAHVSWVLWSTAPSSDQDMLGFSLRLPDRPLRPPRPRFLGAILALLPIVALCWITLMIWKHGVTAETSALIWYATPALILVPFPFAVAAAWRGSWSLGLICTAYGSAVAALWIVFITEDLVSHGRQEPTTIHGEYIKWVSYGILLALCLLASAHTFLSRRRFFEGLGYRRFLWR